MGDAPTNGPDRGAARAPNEAAVAKATGRRADALRAVEQSVVLAAPGGYVRRFVDDGRSIAHLLPLVRAVAPGFVDRLIA